MLFTSLPNAYSSTWLPKKEDNVVDEEYSRDAILLLFIVTEVSPPEKAELPMLVTLPGMVTEVRPGQPSKA